MMKKGRRGRQEGSIFRQMDPVRGERWVGQLDAGRTLNGKRRRVRVYAKTRQEVADRLTALVHQQRNERRPVLTDRETLAAFLQRWLTDIVKPSVRPTTHRSYAQLVNLHISPALGHLQVRHVTTRDVQRFLRLKEEAGLSPRTCQYLKAVLRTALSVAVEWDLTSRNVAVAARPPKQGRYECQPLTPEQAQTFVDSISGHPQRALFTLALTTGMRQGEVLGLRWVDVDLEAGVLRVRHTLQAMPGEKQPNGKRVRVYELAPPKTEQSKRSVALPSFTVDALRAHHRSQAEARLALGEAWQNTRGLVFTAGDGAPLDGVNVTHMLKRLLRKAGLPDQRFHDLRHAAATYLLTKGVQIRVVADVLGHADVRTTQNIYQHVMETVQRAAADQMDAVFKRA